MESEAFNECPFCDVNANRVLMQNDLVLAFFDNYAVSNGHTLVISKRHVVSLFELDKPEFVAIWSMVAQVRLKLMELHSPQGFNIGLNDGKAAGQTVNHAHIHVIPRYQGDVSDPRGGIRWVIPAKATYWGQ
jgi:diadenosine tetraphosphate (Ap4A) HIT family hydrolase